MKEKKKLRDFISSNEGVVMDDSRRTDHRYVYIKFVEYKEQNKDALLELINDSDTLHTNAEYGSDFWRVYTK